MSILYTADLHLGHANVLKFEDRGCKTLEQMNILLRDAWNNRVCKQDTVYIIGDIAMGYKKMGWSFDDLVAYINSLNGKKILIIGNHDYDISKLRSSGCFEEIKDYARIKDGEHDVILFHYPIAVWDKQHWGSIHVYGHTHTSNFKTCFADLTKAKNAYCASVGEIGYAPWSLEEFKKAYGYDAEAYLPSKTNSSN